MIYKFKSKAAGDVIMMGPSGDQVLRIIGPALQSKIALCTPDHEPLSEAGSAVLIILKEMLQDMLNRKYGE